MANQNNRLDTTVGLSKTADPAESVAKNPPRPTPTPEPNNDLLPGEVVFGASSQGTAQAEEQDLLPGEVSLQPGSPGHKAINEMDLPSVSPRKLDQGFEGAERVPLPEGQLPNMVPITAAGAPALDSNIGVMPGLETVARGAEEDIAQPIKDFVSDKDVQRFAIEEGFPLAAGIAAAAYTGGASFIPFTGAQMAAGAAGKGVGLTASTAIGYREQYPELDEYIRDMGLESIYALGGEVVGRIARKGWDTLRLVYATMRGNRDELADTVIDIGLRDANMQEVVAAQELIDRGMKEGIYEGSATMELLTANGLVRTMASIAKSQHRRKFIESLARQRLISKKAADRLMDEISKNVVDKDALGKIIKDYTGRELDEITMRLDPMQAKGVVPIKKAQRKFFEEKVMPMQEAMTTLYNEWGAKYRFKYAEVEELITNAVKDSPNPSMYHLTYNSNKLASVIDISKRPSKNEKSFLELVNELTGTKAKRKEIKKFNTSSERFKTLDEKLGVKPESTAGEMPTGTKGTIQTKSGAKITRPTPIDNELKFEIRTIIDSIKEGTYETLPPELGNVIKRFKDAPERISFSAAQKIRSTLIKRKLAVAAINPQHDSISYLNRWISAMDNHLEDGLKNLKVGDEEKNLILKKWRDANEFYKQGARTYQNDVIVDIMNNDPIKVANMLETGGVETLEKVEKVLAKSPETMRHVKDLYLYNTVVKATAGPQGRYIDPDKLAGLMDIHKDITHAPNIMNPEQLKLFNRLTKNPPERKQLYRTVLDNMPATDVAKLFLKTESDENIKMIWNIVGETGNRKALTKGVLTDIYDNSLKAITGEEAIESVVVKKAKEGKSLEMLVPDIVPDFKKMKEHLAIEGAANPYRTVLKFLHKQPESAQQIKTFTETVKRFATLEEGHLASGMIGTIIQNAKLQNTLRGIIEVAMATAKGSKIGAVLGSAGRPVLTILGVTAMQNFMADIMTQPKYVNKFIQAALAQQKGEAEKVGKIANSLITNLVGPKFIRRTAEDFIRSMSTVDMLQFATARGAQMKAADLMQEEE